MNKPINPDSLSHYLELSSLVAKQNKTVDRNLGIVHGIGITEFLVMQALQNAPQQTMSRIDLASAIGLSASGITRLLNPMEKIGLVEKEKNARDARVSLVKLSTAGQRIYREALPTAGDACETFFSAFNAKQKHTFSSLITILA